MKIHKKNHYFEVLKRTEEYYAQKIIKPVVEVKSTRTLILGDIHGDYKTCQKILNEEFKTEIGEIDHFIFLGDYIDRGPSGLEVLYLLFSKLLEDPSKITLLQGNHEMPMINGMYGFQAECTNIFGNKGSEIYERWNRIFSKLPVMGFLNKAAFFVHGGIGPNILTYNKQELLDLKELDEGILMNSLWSDPNDGQFSENDMFVSSFRGQGFLFGEKAFQKFLKQMHVKAMFRAHMVYGAIGYNSLFNDRLISLFTCAEPPYNVKPYGAYVDFKKNHVKPVPI